jgi:ABC-type sulfate/molybdate transport systems ATPase subunit
MSGGARAAEGSEAADPGRASNGLDPAGQLDMRRLIRDLSGARTIMLSTHDMDEVEELCGRAGIISGGKLLAEGTPEQLRGPSCWCRGAESPVSQPDFRCKNRLIVIVCYHPQSGAHYAQWPESRTEVAGDAGVTARRHRLRVIDAAAASGRGGVGAAWSAEQRQRGRRGANRSPWSATRARVRSAVKNRSSRVRQDSTSSQLTGVEAVGCARARSE